jgi:hypothetical protein
MMQVTKKSSTFRRILQKFFSVPAIVLIGSSEKQTVSVWKTGKTDFFLLVSEILLEMGLVDEVATNVDTGGHYPYIHDLENLKLWLHRNNKIKLFGLDEANVHLPARRAMSTKSVDTLQIFPEISKAHSRLIIIGQKISSLDNELRDYGWVKGKMLKLSLKTVYIESPLLHKPYIIRNIPRTHISFDPYLQAPFSLKPTDKQTFQDLDLEKAWRWCNGSKWRDEFKHPQEANRFIRAMMKRLLQTYSQFTYTSVEDTVNKTSELNE